MIENISQKANTVDGRNPANHLGFTKQGTTGAGFLPSTVSLGDRVVDLALNQSY